MSKFTNNSGSRTHIQGADSSSRNAVHIAIVEDDPLFRNAVKYRLGKLDGVKIFCFESGETFVKEFQEADPHIVILDYKLTDSFLSRLNGIDVIREVKKIKRDARIILTSSQDSMDIAAETIKAGASEYVVKDHRTLRNLERHVTLMSNQIRSRYEARKEKTWIIACLLIIILLVLYSAMLRNSNVNSNVASALLLVSVPVLLVSIFLYSRHHRGQDFQSKNENPDDAGPGSG